MKSCVEAMSPPTTHGPSSRSRIPPKGSNTSFRMSSDGRNTVSMFLHLSAATYREPHFKSSRPRYLIASYYSYINIHDTGIKKRGRI
ncbi:hypothetical protein TWF694_003974 [Orbilia ellipsospora]|uniref:Uncharacterized protein n=1 Tax=Orbilia ellipsospora TaxID=2528407 RepID=A0AAV9WY16_9PEZI